MKQRERGVGTVYQRGDGLWCASVEVASPDGRRRRKVVASKSEDVVRAKIAALVPTSPAPVMSRAEMLAAARARGSHTPAEAALKRRASTACRYCGTALSWANVTEDHIVPLATGGSDAIDNLQYICWECNLAKRVSADYAYDGPRPRPFAPHPKRRHLVEATRAAHHEGGAA